MNKKDEKLLTSLCAQIEEAWINERNSNLVEQLGIKYPEHADELFAFLELLLFADLEGEALLETAQIKEDAKRSNEWLEHEGYTLAASIAKAGNETPRHSPSPPTSALVSGKSNTPAGNNEQLMIVNSTCGDERFSKHSTFLIVMKKETGKRGTELANLLGVTYPFLLETSRYPAILPWPAKCEFVELAEQRCGVSPQISWQAFENHPIELRIAKHRTGPCPEALPNYIDIVRRSGMDEERQNFWLSKLSEDKK